MNETSKKLWPCFWLFCWIGFWFEFFDTVSCVYIHPVGLELTIWGCPWISWPPDSYLPSAGDRTWDFRHAWPAFHQLNNNSTTVWGIVSFFLPQVQLDTLGKILLKQKIHPRRETLQRAAAICEQKLWADAHWLLRTHRQFHHSTRFWKVQKDIYKKFLGHILSMRF